MRWHPPAHPLAPAQGWWFLLLLLGLTTATYPAPRAQPQHYGKPKQKFMPSDPGKPPSCLKDPRLTYCTDPDDYPKERILYLLQNNMFDVSTFLMDETRDTYTFEGRDPPQPMYSYQPPQQGYLPPAPTQSYGNATQYHQPKSSYYARATPSKYGSRSSAPPGGGVADYQSNGVHQFTLPSTVNASSSYASYQPPPHPPPSTQYGRGLPSSPYLYNEPTAYSYDDVDVTPYPRYPKPSSSSPHLPSRYMGPRTPPQKSHTWWRKLSSPGRRYRRQLPGGGDDTTTDLCPSRANYINPRAAQSIQGDWMFLVNLDSNPEYTQLVRSEVCIRNQCSGSCQAPPGAVAVCQQQFVQKRLVALANNGERLNQDIFWFPSCCVCKIRR